MSIYLGHSYPARQEAVDRLLEHGPGQVVIDGQIEETRSGWRWFRLANGDLICGFYPQGDWGYVGSEIAWSHDWLAAEQAGTVTRIEADAESQS